MMGRMKEKEHTLVMFTHFGSIYKATGLVPEANPIRAMTKSIITNICKGVHVPVHWLHNSGGHHRGRRAFGCFPQGSTGQLDHDADDDDDDQIDDDNDDQIEYDDNDNDADAENDDQIEYNCYSLQTSVFVTAIV